MFAVDNDGVPRASRRMTGRVAQRDRTAFTLDGHRFDTCRVTISLKIRHWRATVPVRGASSRFLISLILPRVKGLDLGMDPIRQTSKSSLRQSANEGVIGSLLTPMDRGRGKITGHARDGLARISRFFDAEGDIRLVRSRVNQA